MLQNTRFCSKQSKPNSKNIANYSYNTSIKQRSYFTSSVIHMEVCDTHFHFPILHGISLKILFLHSCLLFFFNSIMNSTNLLYFFWLIHIRYHLISRLFRKNIRFLNIMNWLGVFKIRTLKENKPNKQQTVFTLPDQFS